MTTEKLKTDITCYNGRLARTTTQASITSCPPLEGGPKSMISRWGLIPSTFALVNPLKANAHRYVIPQRFRGEPRRAVALRDLKQKNDTS